MKEIDVAPDTQDSTLSSGNNTTSSDLKFPKTNQTDIPIWMSFTRKKYSKETMVATSTLTTVEGSKMIVLPIPQQLNKQYLFDWDQESLGAWGTQLMKAVPSSYQAMSNFVHNAATKGAWVSAKDEIENFNASALGDTLKNAAVTYAVDAATSLDVARKLGTVAGVARNPFKALMYNSPNFRIFTFQYKLISKNIDEANTVRDIIKEFQVGMSPGFAEGFANALYTYPDVFQINISEDKYLFKLAPCILRDISVDYHSEGSPIYFRTRDGTRVPGSVTIGLTFMETAIITKEDFETGGF